ncbi:YcxB family protein [Streptomyces sp. NPDC001985]|uniref:YcxB family protein n=1 Tax=Streptomyces sp. NPDC001985 TaxID=3154406 RepID=UPI003316D273
MPELPTAAGPETVELRYTTTVRDLESALRVRLARTPAGRLQLVIWSSVAVFGLVTAWLRAEAVGKVLDPFAAGLVGLSCFLLVMTALSPRTQARQAYRLFQRYGELRAVVDSAGVHITSPDFSQSFGWSTLDRYRETEEHFVLLSPDRTSAALGVLPKRGLAEPADADRLRALLDRCVRRV